MKSKNIYQFYNNEKEIKVIIFDLGGVIIRSVFPILSQKIKALYGVPKRKIKENYYRNLGNWELGKISENEFWKEFKKNLNLETKIKKLKEIYYSSIILRPDVLKIVKKLRKNYKIALLTNVNRGLMQFLNKKYRLNKIFDVILPSYKYGIAKPRLKKYLKKSQKLNYLRIYQLLLEKLRIDPHCCVFIDDKKENLIPAKNLGMKTILFKNSNELRKKLHSLGVKI
jgi:epoxide hydrolase-like predicted phosphatase